eukprot:CAMPEP_0197725230 /NCGR_PEP_ID=MMETSP1434-20131217/6845_1 /TAXON_ID=265543 /ORGANISM="Minutocellus polymorphus, Strain CCMP3303" /LENGTH=328 /DNA_ID=CAMNT_0043310683 /DNA_START=68 /DNA_END=1054 /DNA_ORIENTATION=-
MYRLAVIALLATSVAAKGGCPSTDLTLDDWLSNAGGTHGACETDDHCQNAGECCVNFHLNYCGVPSDCNEFLQCAGSGSGAAFEVSSLSDPVPATNDAFQTLLARADGGGAYYDGCPPRIETWDGYLAKGGACTTNAGCSDDNAGACCVAYTFPYCGVPSDCNSFLQCFSPAQEATATTAAIDEGASSEDQSDAFAAALEKLQMTGGNETDSGMGGIDPSGIVEKLGACVNAETMDIDMQCIQGVLSTLDPSIIGKLAQCAGLGSIAEMQVCVEEQLSGGGEVTEPPAGSTSTPPVADPTNPPSSATSASATAYVIGILVAAAAYLSS